MPKVPPDNWERGFIADLIIGGLFAAMLIGFGIWWFVEWIAL
jgi:hypothetical protein